MATSTKGTTFVNLDFGGTLLNVITGTTLSATVSRAGINSASGVSLDPAASYTDGTGAGQANKWYLNYRTLAATTNDDLDLAGVLTDPFGSTLTFTAIKSIFVAIDYGSTAYDGTKSLTIGPGSASNFFAGPFAGTNPTQTFDKFFIACIGTAAGWTVTAATGDILRIRNPGASSVSYLIWIQGI